VGYFLKIITLEKRVYNQIIDDMLTKHTMRIFKKFEGMVFLN